MLVEIGVVWYASHATCARCHILAHSRSRRTLQAGFGRGPAASAASILPMLASAPQSRPASNRAAAFHHQLGGGRLRMRAGDRELHALVLAIGRPNTMRLGVAPLARRMK
jgi:hypothetical protein